MTGYTVHTGTSKKFVSGWDRIFSDTNKDDSSKQGKNASTTSKTKPSVKGNSGKAAAKKTAGKAGKKKAAGKKKST